MATPAVRVAMPCTGLGREARGFEAFARALAGALRDEPRVALTLYGGGGDLRAGERAVWNLPRASRAARAISRLVRRGPYFVEQMTFCAGFLPSLVAQRPDLVYFADLNLGNALWHWRRVTGQRFAMLYYNGGATTMPYTRCDHVQQVSPEHFDAAMRRGERADRMTLLPHGMAVPRVLPARDAARVAATRAALGVRPGCAMLLSVGMLDATVKRMDALVEAVARLGDDRPHLVMLGARSPETPHLEQMARARLGDAVTLATWPGERMPAAYEAADAFALLSLREGFGLAYLEATAAGLPCVAHDTPTARYILGPAGLVGDTTNGEATTALLRTALGVEDSAARTARHAWAWEHFSWDHLAPRYADLFATCAARVGAP